MMLEKHYKDQFVQNQANFIIYDNKFYACVHNYPKANTEDRSFPVFRDASHALPNNSSIPFYPGYPDFTILVLQY